MKFVLVASLGINGLTMANEPAKVVGDAAKGKAVSTTCVACHGADGNSVTAIWPKIAGQGDAYIIKQLNDFRSGSRVEASMTPMAKAIASDEDVLHLAAYFSSQKTKLATANEDKVKLGEAIYRGGNLTTGVAACAACHGPTGSGNVAAKFPQVAGQHAQYTVIQLKAFKSGKRNNDVGEIMRGIAKNMTEEEMEAVAEYISGLRSK